MSTSAKKTCRSKIYSLMMAIATIVSPIVSIASIAEAVPLPKDWCGRIWGVVINGSIVWDNPNTAGATNATPPSNVAAIPALPNGSYATLGLHARSGTFYTLDRTTRTLYQYSMSTGGSWTSTQLTQIPVAVNGQPATNYNKMTVTGNDLIIANSPSTSVYTFPITPATGALSSVGLVTAVTYTLDSNTALPNGTFGSPPGATGGLANNGAANVPGTNANIDGGDIAQDEYGDTYMITYDTYDSLSTNQINPATQYAYFYKKVGIQWQYRGRVIKATRADQFAGFAFYNDTVYLKGTAGQLFKLATLTHSGNEYNWSLVNNTILTPFSAGTGVADLASCGVPAIGVTKTQDIYTDAAGNTPTSDQARIGTGHYIKYTITGVNSGDAWSRSTYLNDVLPAGVEYVPNSATENGVNLNAATYPFTAAVATSPGSLIGEIRLPYNGNTNTVIYTYVVKVNGAAPTVQNQAKIGYANPYPSDPPNCSTGLNCGESILLHLFPSIFGTVWNDINGSANQTFNNIFTAGEVGTNTGAGTTVPIYTVLVDSMNKVVASQPVNLDGKYAFSAINTNQTGLTIRLSTTPGTVGSAPPAASIPVGWKSTSPTAHAAFNIGTTDVLNEDFGISLPADIILVKRITAINGLTINPNDNTVLTNVLNNSATTNDDPGKKWPAGYLKGAFNAGIIRPGDTVEYTIYYLNNGSADTKNLKICDPIRGRQTYVPGSMKLQLGGNSTEISLTDLDTDTTVDRANVYSAGAANVPPRCNAGSTTVTGRDNGGVTIQITGAGANLQPDMPVILGATAAGTPTGSYGLFRFTARVDP